MSLNNGIDLEQIEDDLEESYEEKLSLGIDDVYVSDSSKMWSLEIAKFPLLTIDEEKRYGNSLKLNKGILYEGVNIDMDKVFILLSKSKYSEDILNYLYGLFSSINSESNSVIFNKLRKYVSIKKSLNRFLNEEELLKYFNISEKYELDDNTFLKDVNNYVLYMNARDKMTCSNLRLVSSVASKYSYKTNVDFLDLASEGTIGLMKAVERFDVDLGYKFSTHAMWWIRQSILKYLATNLSDYKVPFSYYKEVKEFRELVNKLEKEAGKKLTVDNLMILTGFSRDAIIDYLNYQSRAVSLDTPIGDEEDSTLGDFVLAEEEDMIGSLFQSNMGEEIEEKLFKFLTEEEIEIVKLRFGLNESQENMDIYSIAKLLHKSRSRINNIFNRAFIKMRHAAKREDTKSLELLIK